MTDVNKLMTDAKKQLDEHVVWLAAEIAEMPAEVGMVGARMFLVEQCKEIKLRMVNANHGRVSIVYDYPDELIAFLQSPVAPQHLRDTLAGGHLVSTEQPVSTLNRAGADDI